MKGPPTVRLDQALVDRGLAPSIERARIEILTGNVLVDESPGARGPAKPSDRVRPAQVLRLREAPARYVSRGGLKLEAALDRFGVDVRDRVAVDLGASTGGFTDCLLQRGAGRVYAVDVGHNQLAWSLRNDPRVVCLEGTDAREVALPEAVGLVVGDLSFISLARVLPAVARLLSAAPDPAIPPGPGGPPRPPARNPDPSPTPDRGGPPRPPEAILLIKPQFEVAAADVGTGGKVTDPVARQAAIDRVLAACVVAGLTVHGWMDCPVPGARAGNVEALVWASRRVSD